MIEVLDVIEKIDEVILDLGQPPAALQLIDPIPGSAGSAS